MVNPLQVNPLQANPLQANRIERRAWLQLLGALGALVALSCALPGPMTTVAMLTGHRAALIPGSGTAAVSETAMLTVAAIVVWGLLLWGAVVTLAAVAGRLPGVVGFRGRRLLARIAPDAARKLILTAVGVGMVTGLSACGVGATAATPAGAHGHEQVRVATGALGEHRVAPDPAVGAKPIVAGQAWSWTSVEGSAVQLRSGRNASPQDSSATGPIGSQANTRSQANSGRQLNIDWPTTSGSSAAANHGKSIDIDWPTVVEPIDSSQPKQPGSPQGPVDIDWPAASDPVVVLRGDSLWSIAARHLPADASPSAIDLSWRQWYAANKSVIGSDPNLILPGQILLPPTPGTGN